MHHRLDVEGRDLSGNRRTRRPTPTPMLGRRIFVLAGLGTMFAGLAARSARAAPGQGDASPQCLTQGRVGAWTYEAEIDDEASIGGNYLRIVECAQGAVTAYYGSLDGPSRSRMKEEPASFDVQIMVHVPGDLGFAATSAMLAIGAISETVEMMPSRFISVKFRSTGLERALRNGEGDLVLTLQDAAAGRSRTIPITLQPGLSAALEAGLAELARLEARAVAKSSDPARCKLVDPGCFITTACLAVLGLPDDRWELRALRTFRDGRLWRMPGGQEEIDLYYRVAPAINARLLSRPDAGARYRRLYRRYIFPAACLAVLRLDRAARRTYRAMMHELMTSPAHGVSWFDRM